MRPVCLCVVMLIMAGVSHAQAPKVARPKGDSALGRRIPNIVLTDSAGKKTGITDFKDNKAIVVVFLGTQCPIGNAYIPILNELQESYKDKKVQLIGINANLGNNAAAIAKHVREYKIAFPVLVDAEQAVKSVFTVQRMCEAFVLDERQVVRYAGRIDDRIGYDYKRADPKRFDLQEAIDEVLAGKTVSVARTEVAGCLITARTAKRAKGEVTYAKHVAPIFQKHCADCHHPGTAAPFSLLSYDDAASWSAMIREVVEQRRMPPWHADPRHGQFHNERRLAQADIDTLVAWVEDGMPKGEMKDAPPAPAYAEGWRIGKPDAIFKMPTEYTVQTKGTVSYKYFRVKTDFKEDRWVQAAEARPGNAAVVHHIIVFSRAPGVGSRPIWIAATAPGADPVILPPGHGRKIPAGAELIFQMHYTPIGKEEKDRSEIGLIFCKEPPKVNVATFGVETKFFLIPPGAASHQVISTYKVPRDAVILSFLPHMHLRGKDYEYQAIYPDGRKEVLLSVPQYDFNWQHTYRLTKPLHVPKGTTLRCVAHFDNSPGNPANPNPKSAVFYGEQTWEEMMIGYIDFYWAEEAQVKEK